MDRRQMISMLCSFVLPPVLALLLFTAAITLFILPSIEVALMERKKETVRAVVATAASILAWHAQTVERGERPLVEAQQLAVAEMRAVRFGGNQEYLWIIDQQPVMLMHPYFPELEGTHLTDFSDSRGKRLFVAALEASRQHGGGFVDYMWSKGPSTAEAVPKLSYVKLVEPWGWVVGSGIYLEDVRQEIRSVTYQVLIISVVIGVTVLLLLLFVVHRGWRSERARYQAEEELIRSREQYRALAHASGEITLLVIDGLVVGANRKACENLGMSEGELIGRKFISLVGNGDSIVDQSISNDVVEGGTLDPVEAVLRGKSAELRILLSAEGVVVHNGPAILYTGYPLLATDRQENLPIALDLLEKCGFSMLLLDNRHSGKIVYADRNVEKMWHLDSGQSLLGKPISTLLTEADAKRLLVELGEEKLACHLRLKIEGESDRHLLVWALLVEGERATRGQVVVLVVDDTNAAMARQAVDGLLERSLSTERLLLSDCQKASRDISDGQSRQQFRHATVVIRQAIQTGMYGDEATGIADRAIDRVFQAAVGRTIDKLGPPPAPYALLAVGSIGRREPMLHPDQDTGVIFSTGDGSSRCQQYFLDFGRYVTDFAASAGLPPCKAGNCAENPDWCMSESGWQRLFSKWINSSTPDDLLKVNIFFDLRTMIGDDSLTHRLRQKIFSQVGERPIFLFYLAQSTLDFHLPADFLGRLRTREMGGSDVNLKGMMLHFVNFARIYTLRNGISETNTIKRLNALITGKYLPLDLLQDTLDAWKFLLQIRFANQVAVEAKNFSQKNIVLLEELTPWQESILKMAAGQVGSLQQRLSVDFTRLT